VTNLPLYFPISLGQGHSEAAAQARRPLVIVTYLHLEQAPWPIPSSRCQATEYYSNATEQNNWSTFHTSTAIFEPQSMTFARESNHQSILQIPSEGTYISHPLCRNMLVVVGFIAVKNNYFCHHHPTSPRLRQNQIMGWGALACAPRTVRR